MVAAALARRRVQTPIKAFAALLLFFVTNWASYKAGSDGKSTGKLHDSQHRAGTAATPSNESSTEFSAVFNLGGGDVLAKRTFPVILDEQSYFIASPSIVSLPSGRILIAFERQGAWGLKEPKSTSSKMVLSSDDGGMSWQSAGSAAPMQWPTIFSCASGTYMIGVQRHFTPDNQVVITKMLDSGGREWSPMAILTQGISAVMANTGVDVSLGRVTKAFETIPVMARPVKASTVRAEVRVKISMGATRFSWQNPPVVDITVADSEGFTAHTLLKVPFQPHPLFFRVLSVDHSTDTLQLRLEKFTLFWITSDVVIPAGAVVALGSGANIYGAVDWVSVAMSADETADLRDPKAWTYSEALGNPASTSVQPLAALLDVAFRPDYAVRKSIVGFDPGTIRNYATALDAGFGSLYWMEGVVVRLQDRRGSSGKLLVTLRVNNDLFCDLAALATLDDSELRSSSSRQPPEAVPNSIHKVLPGSQAEQDGDGGHSSKSGGGAPASPAINAANKARHLAASADPKDPSLIGAIGKASPAAETTAEQQPQRTGTTAAAAAAAVGDATTADGSTSQGSEGAGRATHSQPLPQLHREFLRYKNVPGLAVGHPAIVYDHVTDLYWMASNMNRDSTRVWRQPWQTGTKKLHITPFSSCEVDRTTMGLFYSGNAFDWWTAGIIDYHLDFADHFTYPHMVIAGEDLLVVMRATAPPSQPSSTTAAWYNNHNSNAVSFHRVTDFRRLANVQWATWEGEYSQRPRSTSSNL